MAEAATEGGRGNAPKKSQPESGPVPQRLGDIGTPPADGEAPSPGPGGPSWAILGRP